jgi:hypothetical protein
MMDGYIFNRVWYILISTGLQGLEQLDEFGWRLGLDHIRNKITPRMYKEFFKHVETIVPIPSLEPTKNEIKNKYLTINETLLDMKAWIEAGEFTSLSLIIKSIVDRYCQHKTLTF